jgi:hypothetical protein
MEQPEKFKKLITAMLMIVMTGGIDQRVQYIGLLVNHLNYYIKTEKLSKDRAAILNTRQHLIDAFGFLVSNNVERFKLDEKRYREVMNDFKNHIIVLDQSWGTPQAGFGVQILKELESLQTARQHHFHAVQGYSEYLGGSAAGLTSCTVEIENAMKIITQVCFDNNLANIDEGAFRVAAAARPQPQASEPSKR